MQPSVYDSKPKTGAPIELQMGAPICVNGYTHLYSLGAPTAFAGCTQSCRLGCTQVPHGSSLISAMGAPSKICWVLGCTHWNSMGAPFN